MLTADRPGGLRGGDASASEPCLRIGAGAARLEVTCDFVVMLPRYSEGTSGEGGTQLAGRDLDRMQHYTANVTWLRKPAARVTRRHWCAWWSGGWSSGMERRRGAC